MAKLAEKHKKRLDDIKKSIENAYQYFQENYQRFQDFSTYVFKSSLTVDDIIQLKETGKPTIEFNMLESFLSRLRGEFAKQQPALYVRAADGVPLVDLKDLSPTLDVVQAHLRSILFDANNDKLQYDVYSDLLAGGFSTVEIYPDYASESSFEKNIYVNRVFDPTLCGFDPLARDSHKGDGRFCFQLYPMTKDEFIQLYGKAKADTLKFQKNVTSGFGWSYKNEREEVVLVCDYFEKVKKTENIYKMSDGKTYTEKERDELLRDWEMSGKFEAAPVVVNNRKTDFERIERYRLCENGVLDYKETDFKHLPLIFIDGNSVMLKQNDASYQMTRPYVYHALGIQKLKNFAGQSLANELENLVQHKFKVAKEAIPTEYLEAYTQHQVPNTLIYNNFYENDPEKVLPPPQEIVRPPIPPEITNTFRMSDEMTQVILGSYDLSLGNQQQEISGAAIALGAMQSNSASMPYIVGYIKGLNRIAQVLVDLIPKYYRTPRTLPIMKPDGKRSFVVVNTDNIAAYSDKDKDQSSPIYMNYDSNALDVKVETGVNFAMQKEMALKTIVSLMQASPAFADFMNQDGLQVLLDNLEIRGIDQLRAKAEAYQQNMLKEKQQASQIQSQMAQKQSQLADAQMQIEMQRSQAETAKVAKEAQSPAKTEIDAMKLQMEAKFKEIEAQQKQEKLDIEAAEVLAKIRNMDYEQFAEMAKLDAETARTALDALRSIGGSVIE
jgi:hypothetical protein